MTAFLLIVIAGLSFLGGYLLGYARLQIPSAEMAKTKHKDRDLERLMEEYRNFLSYDGSEQ